MCARQGVQQDPWRARIHDRYGKVLGAGILLPGGRVLTCAHVPESAIGSARGDGDDAKWPVRVDLVGGFPVEHRVARVASGCWVPERADADLGSVGDVAVLELERAPSPHGRREFAAPLRQLAALPDRPVRICGFPASKNEGMWLDATVAGPSGEWVQLNTAAEFGPQVKAGFSGAGVLDKETGTVIGMVTAKSGVADPGVFWMLPVEAVVVHLPSVAGLVTGEPVADPSFLAYQQTTLDDALTDAVRTLVGALRSAGAGQPVVITGDREDARAAAFGLLVARADRGIRSHMPAGFAEDAPPGTVPRVGSIDVAIDATGKTTGQVCQRVARRLGIAVDSSADLVGRLGGDTPMTMVVDAVDNAAEPDALFSELLFPLASAGAKVLVGARSLPAIAEDRVASVRLGSETGPGPLGSASVPDRLDRLDDLVERVGIAEAAAREIAPRILGVPAVAERYVSLKLRVTRLRMSVQRREPIRCDAAGVLHALDTAEKEVVSALRSAETARRELGTLLAVRDDLRGRLDAYRKLAATNGLAEDLEVAELFDAADQTLWRAPCDLPKARANVTAYLHAVWRRRGLDEGQT